MSRWFLALPAAIAGLAVAAAALQGAAPAAAQTHVCENGTVVADPANNTELVADCKILWAAKATLEGTSNVTRRLDWSAATSLSSWHGVTVGGAPSRVTAFELDSSDDSEQFRGSIPASFGGLTGLTVLTIHWQQIGGSFSGGGIPPELGDLQNLVHLRISSTNVNGAIPASIGKLTKLRVLDLGGNNLGGDIPAEIWGLEGSEEYPGLTELRTLRLHGNKNIHGGPGLTGTIPARIKNFTQLTTLDLHGNRLSGTIPDEIGQLSRLETLRLYLNEFTGSIPASLGTLPLTKLDLRDNRLTGPIPPELEDLLPELEHLDLARNAFTGCVPRRLLEVEYTDAGDLIDLYGMTLCGPGGAVNAAPSISSATVNGAALTLSYGEGLDQGSTPATSAYTVSVNGSTSTHAVDRVAIGGSSVALTLGAAVVASDVVLVSYVPGASPVQDADGARAAALTDYAVTNQTTPDPPLYQSGVVDGGTVTLAYDEALDAGSEPGPEAYTVTADGTTHAVGSVAIGGTTVTLTLQTPVRGGQSVLLSYAPPQASPLQDEDGEDAAELANVTITNNTDLPPVLDGARVDGATLTLTYGEPLDPASEPATSAYTVTVGGAERAVTAVDVGGSAVALTLAQAVVGGESVLVSYQAPQASPLRDRGGTAAGDLTDEAVENLTNNDPVFRTTALTVAEHTQVVGTVVAEDADTQDGVRAYVLKAADPEDDGRMFSIDNTGRLTFRQASGADYEHPGSVGGGAVYRVTVMATSGSGSRERMSVRQLGVTVTNVEEDGRLLLSSGQPQVGTALLATVDDPDGGVAVTGWSWEISPDRSTWTALTHQTTPGSPSASYAPVAADEGKYIRITADYDDAVTGAEQVQRLPGAAVRAEPASNSAPAFPASETGRRSVPEETAPNVNIGHPVTATDADSDPLTYGLGGTDAGSFDIVALSGQLRTLAPLDYETTSSYEVVVTATDPSGEEARITVTITVTDVAERNWETEAPPRTGPGPSGPFVGASGPEPSDDDFGWSVTGDIDPLDAAHGEPTGLWGDGETLWVGQNGDGAADGVFAYDLQGGARVPGLEFELDQTNRAPRGVWSDGETMWVSDSGQERLFAYDLGGGARLEGSEIALASRNADARGIWSDGETVWVLDGRRDALFAYGLATGHSRGEFALGGGNDDPHGIWSDGTIVWVSDHGAKRLVAYVMPAAADGGGAGTVALERAAALDFAGLSRAGNNSPRGIWSDGALMYVVDAYDDRIYTYNMPPSSDARLASLALSGVEIGEFSSLRTDYTGVPAEEVETTTVSAAATQPDALVEITPVDGDGDPGNGHQVGVDGDPVVEVTVTSPDGGRTRTYRVRIESAEPEPETEPEVPEWPYAECLRGLTPGALSYVVYGGGSIADLVDCFSGRGVAAVWGNPDERWIPLVFGAPAFVNLRFSDHYDAGIAPYTPFIAWRDLRERPVVRRRAPGTETPAVVAPEPAPASDPGEQRTATRVIGNTGGDGVSHRGACRDGARLSAVGGWPDGTEVEVLEEGSGDCAGWLRVRSGAVTSWVRERYLLEPGAGPGQREAEAPRPPEGATRVIGNTGGDGVSHRGACRDGARLSAVGGWPDGTEVEVVEEGSGDCTGWLRVRSGAVTSWVRERYLLEPGAEPGQREAEASRPPEGATHVIGNTGGDGVSHRSACRDDARLSGVGGWPDGTYVEVLGTGSGSCLGWLRVRSGAVTSWVREQYVIWLMMGPGKD